MISKGAVDMNTHILILFMMTLTHCAESLRITMANSCFLLIMLLLCTNISRAFFHSENSDNSPLHRGERSNGWVINR